MKSIRELVLMAVLGIPLLLTGCGANAVSGITFPNASDSYASAPLETIQLELEGMGFENVQSEEVANDLDPSHDGQVTGFSVDGNTSFEEGATFDAGVPIQVSTYGSYVTPVEVKTSTDRHVQYIRNYRGMNAASFGYTSLGGDRRDTYGNATIKIVFVASDGTIGDFTDEELLKDYIVYDQNIEPGTEMQVAFQTDSSGNEYDNLEAWMGFDEIVLDIKKMGEHDGDPIAMTAINAGDKYNRFIGDYVGRNLANFGYTSWLGDRRVYMGDGNIKLNLIAEDGSFVDPNDYENLKNYVVTGQSLEPNTPVGVSFSRDSSGKESENLGHASIESMDLTLKRVG